MSWPGQSERWRGRRRTNRPKRQRGNTHDNQIELQLHAVNKGKYYKQQINVTAFQATLKCWLLWGLMRKQETKQSIISSTSAFWLPVPLQKGLAGLKSRAWWDRGAKVILVSWSLLWTGVDHNTLINNLRDLHQKIFVYVMWLEWRNDCWPVYLYWLYRPFSPASDTSTSRTKYVLNALLPP